MYPLSEGSTFGVFFFFEVFLLAEERDQTQIKNKDTKMDKEDTNNHHHHHHHHRHDHGQRPTHLLLCLTGSVATIKAVPLIQQLRQKFQSKLEIKIVVTDAATKFVDVEVLKKEFGIEVYSDEMEWMVRKSIFTFGLILF